LIKNGLKNNFVIFRTGSNRKWKVIALILALICLALITVIIFMAYNRKQCKFISRIDLLKYSFLACDPNDEPITTTTEISMSNLKKMFIMI